MIVKRGLSPLFCNDFCNTIESISQYKLVKNKFKTSNVIEICEMTQVQQAKCRIYLNTIMRDAIETFKVLQINSDSVNSMENNNVVVSNYVFEMLEPGNGVSNERYDIGLLNINNAPHIYAYTVVFLLNTVDNSKCIVSISQQETQVDVVTGNCIFIPCGVESTFSIKNINGKVPLYFMTCNILLTV